MKGIVLRGCAVVPLLGVLLVDSPLGAVLLLGLLALLMTFSIERLIPPPPLQPASGSRR